MNKILLRMLFPAIVVLMSMGVSLAQDIEPIEFPNMPGDVSGAATPKVGVPSVGDLMMLVDKAATDAGEGKDWATPIKLVIIFSGLAIVPSLLVMMTSFTRIVIVLAFVRRALSTQTIPPTVAIIGLAMFLTLYTMAPTFEKANASSIQPYLADEITFQMAGARAGSCIKEFMLRQCREADLALFVKMAKIKRPSSPMDIGMHVVTPAFIISEFRTLTGGYGNCVHLAQRRYDDAAPGDDFAAFQADIVHSCRWVGTAGEKSEPEFQIEFRS